MKYSFLGNRLVLAFLIAPLVPIFVFIVPFIMGARIWFLGIFFTFVFAYSLTGFFMVPLFILIEHKGWYNFLTIIFAPFAALFLILLIFNIILFSGHVVEVFDYELALKFFLIDPFKAGALGAISGLVFYLIYKPE